MAKAPPARYWKASIGPLASAQVAPLSPGDSVEIPIDLPPGSQAEGDVGHGPGFGANRSKYRTRQKSAELAGVPRRAGNLHERDREIRERRVRIRGEELRFERLERFARQQVRHELLSMCDPVALRVSAPIPTAPLVPSLKLPFEKVPPWRVTVALLLI